MVPSTDTRPVILYGELVYTGRDTVNVIPGELSLFTLPGKKHDSKKIFEL